MELKHIFKWITKDNISNIFDISNSYEYMI